MGPMTPTAHRAYMDYCRLATQEAGSAWFDELLYGGFDCWPRDLQDAYPGLATWQGLAHLKQHLRRFVNMRDDLPVLLANRSAQLVRIAARTLRSVCRGVLITDLTWPAYQTILEQELRRSRCHITCVPLRDDIRSGELDVETLLAHISEAYRKNYCDAVFLPAVSHDGIRLPIDAIIERLESRGSVQLKIVDGAQEFCQLPVDLSGEHIDLYLASSHKWLGGQIPMGIALCGSGRTYALLDWLQRDRSLRHALEDPLLRFCNEIEHEATNGFGETVNLAGLFTCQGALVDAGEGTEAVSQRLTSRCINSARVKQLVAESGWRELPAAVGSASGMTVVQHFTQNEVTGEQLRRAFIVFGIALTAYDGGVVRVSMPPARLLDSSVSLLHRAFDHCGRGRTAFDVPRRHSLSKHATAH